MHQHPRPAPVTASPASSPRTNPTRTNNPPEEDRAGSGTSSERGSITPDSLNLGARAPDASIRDRDSLTRLDQVIQVTYYKPKICA